MLEFREETQVRAIVFLAWDGGDMLGAILKQPETPWQSIWRFDHEGETGRRWFTATADEHDGPEKLTRTLFLAFVLAQAHFQETLHVADWMDIRGTGMDAMAVLRKKSWCHLSRTGDLSLN